MSRPVLPLVAIVALSVSVACADGRERLSPPSLTVTLGDSVVPPGGGISGSLTAVDPNGIVYISVRLRCAETDSVLRVQSDGSVPRLDSLTRGFTLEVPGTVPANTRLVVEGAAIDDQNFTVTTRDTIYARVPGVPRDQPPSAARCASGAAD